MTKKWLLSILIFVLLLNPALPATAASVKASIPDFDVHLNGILAANNDYTEYPLLKYNDITYFPMTWYNCRLLGLETQWSDKLGLTITLNNALTSTMGYYPQNGANPTAISVTIPTFPITVNGQAIDNNKEPYPLLNFRDVTYFPLTWHFATDAFGWSYQYNTANGLTITSGNPQIQSFPVLYGRTALAPIRLLDQGCYYYMNGPEHYDYVADPSTLRKTLEIYQAPLDNSFRARKIYTFATPPASLDFALLDGEPYIIYQLTAAETFQALCITKDGSTQPVKLDLANYTNGLSAGNRQGDWRYSLQNHYLCRSTTAAAPEIYSAYTADWFGLTGNQVFYTHPIGQNIGNLYQATGTRADKKLTDEKIRSATIQDGYIVCLLDASEDYGAKIFKSDGSLCLALPGPIDMISLNDDTILAVTYFGQNQDTIKIVHLK